MNLKDKFDKSSLDQLDENELSEVLDASKKISVPKTIEVLEATVRKTSIGTDTKKTDYTDFSQIVAWYKHRGATIIRDKVRLVVLYYDSVLIYSTEKVRETAKEATKTPKSKQLGTSPERLRK